MFIKLVFKLFVFVYFFTPLTGYAIEKNPWEEWIPYQGGYFDLQNREFAIKPQFDSAEKFQDNGLAKIRQNRKYGYINEKGKFVIKPQFDDAYSFRDNGLAKIRQNRKYGYINETGKFVIKPQFDGAEYFDDNGLARVSQYGKWGYINEKGKFVIKPQFYKAEYFDDNGLARVSRQYGKWGYINEKGESILRTTEGCRGKVITYLGKVVFDDSLSGVSLFGENLFCTDRSKMRSAIKHAGGTVKKEDYQKWGDSYYSSGLFRESSELYVSYSVDDKAFVLAQYTLPSRMDAKQITRVKDMVVSKYGKPDQQSGNPSLGKASFLWKLHDDISLKLSRDWPNTTTYLTYKHDKNYNAQQAEMNRQKKAREQKLYKSQQNNF
jgi:hypothetical protein